MKQSSGLPKAGKKSARSPSGSAARPQDAVSSPPWRPPYPPSWADRLTAWVDRLPGPAWVVYASAMLVGALLLHGLMWRDGLLPMWSLGATPALRSVLGVYGIAMVHLLDRTAARSLKGFLPALGLNPPALDELTYRLTTMPAVPAALAGLAGLGALGVIYWTTPGYISLLPGAPAGDLLSQAYRAIAFVILFTVGYHSLRQLVLVSRIHRQAPHIHLLRREPLYAFSSLTARTSIAGLIPIYLMAALYPQLVRTIVIGPLLLAGALLMIAVFAWPLWSVHSRLVEEKARMTTEANQRVEHLIDRLHRRVDADDLARMDDLNKAMASLQTELDILARAPTWPWLPGTVQAVLTAVLLPILLWILQQVLSSYVFV